jgi:hypothetical protein
VDSRCGFAALRGATASDSLRAKSNSANGIRAAMARCAPRSIDHDIVGEVEQPSRPRPRSSYR